MSLFLFHGLTFNKSDRRVCQQQKNMAADNLEEQILKLINRAISKYFCIELQELGHRYF